MIVSLTLGLAWAIRGSFGHEWGAAWAGAMGSFALIVASRNKEWLKNAPLLAALGALGWSVGGISSYGIVIGYCRTNDFVNVLYGFSMLAIIGALYGFIGGGFLGLGLESDKKRKPDWANLITQMIAGGMLAWGFLIYELEWFMTPPRSELWAAAFGASAALGWFLWRNNYRKSLRVAAFSGLGAGFGFAFGNFIQVLGAASGIAYNWWNVMEFTLGFFGGLGMTYAIISSEWNESLHYSKKTNLAAIIFLFVIIPIINFSQTFTTEYFTKHFDVQQTLSAADYANNQIIYGWVIMIVFSIASILLWKNYQKDGSAQNPRIIAALLFANSLYYIFFLIFRKGMLYSGFGLEDSNTLYIPILLLIYFIYYFSSKKSENVIEDKLITNKDNWTLLLGTLVIILLIITFISININVELAGSHFRFK